MKKNTSLLMHLIFTTIVIIELTGRLLDYIQMEYAVKPLIMIWIAVYFLHNKQKTAFTVPVLIAFFFSWLGDNFLMFSGSNELFFFAGVGAFFFAQVTYFFCVLSHCMRIYFRNHQGNPWISIFFLAYIAGMLILLFPGMEGMMKPIIAVYALSLIAMSMMALNRSGRVGDSSFKLVFVGSLLFLLSDSMIAFNKFHSAIPLAGFLIMLTYISAQYLIMRGLILEK